MMLLTKANRARLPSIGATANVDDPVAVVKFFDPTGSTSWYATEFDGEDLFFGWVDGPHPELGNLRTRDRAGSVLLADTGLGIGREPDSHRACHDVRELGGE